MYKIMVDAKTLRYAKSMGKRGPKPKPAKVVIWSSNVAYAVGLFATDGCLSGDGRHIDFTSKDIEQIRNFKKCLDLKVKVSKKTSGVSDKLYSRVQWSDVGLYKFFQSIGLTPRKSKIMGLIDVPEEYFFDFLRGLHDGDGSFYSYWDSRWKSSFMFYTVFVSASSKHIEWLRESIFKRVGVMGHVTFAGRKSTQQLKYAKMDSLKILRLMYQNKDATCLSRKKLKIQKALAIVGQHL